MAERTLTVREAMDRVLESEQAAQQELESCRREAGDILAAARDRARRIQEASERRIGRIHQVVNRALAARIRKMRREAAEKSATFDYEPSHSAAVERAATELARRLTCGDD